MLLSFGSFGVAYSLMIPFGYGWDAATDPTTFDLILRIVSTLSTLAIGIAASVLAYQQFQISKAKLRYELYEKRYDLFLRLRIFVSDLAIGDNRDPLVLQLKAGAFKRDTIECRFLFDEDVVAYFDEVYKQAGDLVKAELEFQRPNLPEEEAERLRKVLTDLHVWCFDQSDAMFNLFQKDLSIKTLREQRTNAPLPMIASCLCLRLNSR